MQVFIVMFNTWRDDNEGGVDYDSQIREVFDSAEKARSYISEHSDETYEGGYSGASFVYKVVFVK